MRESETSSPLSIAGWAATYRVAVHAASLVIVIAALRVSGQIPIEWSPSVDLPEVTVSVSAPGLSPPAVERLVTAPLERELSQGEGVVEVASLSQQGRGRVSLRAARGTDVATFAAMIGESVAYISESFPEGVYASVDRETSGLDAARDPLVTLELIGADVETLRGYATRRLAPSIRGLEGVSSVKVDGSADMEGRVVVSASAARAAGVTSRQIEAAIRDQTRVEPIGAVRSSGGDASASFGGLDAAEALGDVQMAVEDGVVLLRHVATVEVLPAESRSIARVDGTPAIVVEVYRATGSNLIDVAAAVRRVAESTTSPGVRVVVAEDMSVDVRASLLDVARQGVAGVLLILVVLLLVLRNSRTTLLTAWGTMVTGAIGVLVLWVTGLSFNLLTFASSVLLVGLVVDNFTVVLEAIADGDPSSSVALVRQVAPPLIVGTATTVGALLPAAFLPDEVRAVFLPVGVFVSTTLVASLAVAFTVGPASAGWIAGTTASGRSRARDGATWAFQHVLRFPRLVLVALALAVGLPLWAFMPQVDAGPRLWIDVATGGVTRAFAEGVEFRRSWAATGELSLDVSVRAPAGTPVERTDEIARDIEGEVLGDASVERVITRVGGDRLTIRVLFHQEASSSPLPYALRERVVQRILTMSGNQARVVGLTPIPFSIGSDQPPGTVLQVRAYGPDYDDLEAASGVFADWLRSRESRVTNVDTDGAAYGSERSRDVVRIGWEPERVARSRATAAAITAALRPRLAAPLDRFEVALGGTTMPVRVYEERETLDRTLSASLPLTDSTSTRIGLDAFTVEAAPSEIERFAQRYVRHIDVGFSGSGRVGERVLEDHVAEYAPPPGYTFDAGSPDASDLGRWAFFGVLAAAAAIVFLVTAAAFESWGAPGLILLSLPCGFLGMASCFLVAAVPFTEGAAIGALLLVGISVNDAALFLYRFQSLTAAHPSRAPQQLLSVAYRQRFRAMWATTLTSIAAVLPALVAPVRDPFWEGLALTTIGGLSAATALGPIALAAASVCFRRGPSPGECDPRVPLGTDK